VSNLDIVVRPEFKDNLELTRLCSTAVTDVKLHDTVVGHTADVLASGVRRALDLAVHLRGLACHNGTSEQAADLNAAYEASDEHPKAHGREKA
jgi:hypothetical protein